MSMFTRCAHCESTFRVTLAQLQASGGQVRCGVCLEVFDAFVTLTARDPRVPVTEEQAPPVAAEEAVEQASFTLESPLQPPEPAADAATDAGDTHPGVDDDDPLREALDMIQRADTIEPEIPSEPEDEEADWLSVSARVGSDFGGAGPAAPDAEEVPPLGGLLEPAPSWADRADAQGSDAVPDTVVLQETDEAVIADHPVPAPADGLSQEAQWTSQGVFPTSETADIDAAVGVPVEAMAISGAEVPHRPADPDERRQQIGDGTPVPAPLAFAPTRPTRSSVGLIASAAILALLFVVQLGFLLRTTVADAAPALRPPLEAACRWLHCTIALPRLTDRLTIESSDLQALDPLHPNRVTLTALIRNRARVEQALPMLELTLTDARDDVAARKIFGPAEYLAAAPAAAGVAANAELGVRLQLDTGSIIATGYRLYLFHP